MRVVVQRRVNGQIVEHTVDGIPQDGLGDRIAANPIVHAIGKVTGCIDPKTKQLKPDSGCGKMKARLNAGMSFAEAAKLRLQGK